jgi:hypothetical protein
MRLRPPLTTIFVAEVLVKDEAFQESPFDFRLRDSMADAIAATAIKIKTKIRPRISLIALPARLESRLQN